MVRLRRYLRLLAGVLLAAWILQAALNLLVDPYASAPSLDLASLEDARENSSRAAKAERLARGGWDAVVLGTSIANQACDPADPAWGGARVYVAGLPGANLREVRRAFDLAMDRGRPRTVVLFLDLEMVSGALDTRADFDRSLFNPRLRPAEYRLQHLLGWGTTLDSLDVLAAAGDAGGEPRSDARGFRARPTPVRVTWEDFTGNLRGYFHEEFNFHVYAPDRIDDLRAMLARCRREDARAVVLVPPLHALALEAIRLAGLEPSRERLARDAAAAVEEAAALPSGAPAPVLWDFTGYAGPRGEAVPLEGRGAMEWYSDPIHCTAPLGERLLARALGRDDLVPGGFRSFGRRLRPADVPAALEEVRREREAWLPAHREEAERLAAMYRATAAERALRRRIAGLPAER